METALAGILRDLAVGSISINFCLAILGTLFYGISLPIFGRAAYIYTNRRNKGNAARLTIVATILCFSLFTIVSVANFFPLVWDLRQIIDYTTKTSTSASDSSDRKTFIDIMLIDWAEDIMYCVSDILVVWRASILLSRKRWVAGFLILLWLCNLALGIAIEILDANLSTWLTPSDYAAKAVIWYRLGNAASGLSLGLNILTTIIIGTRMWVHQRRMISYGTRPKGPYSRGPMILVWLVEAGLAFSLLQVMDFLLQAGITRPVMPSIILPIDYASWFFSCLFDLVTGVYPALVIIMVDMQKSLMDIVEQTYTTQDTTTSSE